MYNFKELIGHKEEINYLKKIITSKHISHSYLFYGNEGIGKKRLAKAFVKTLFCEKEGATEPCDNCTSCLMMETGNNPDYFEIIPKGASIGVGDIRQQLVERMDIKPYRSKYKIFIIPDADKMTVQAQNALLKTIEEPPAYGIVMLITTKPAKILSTIHSRCTNIRVLPLATDIIEQYILNEYKVESWKASLYANFADGSIGQVQKMFSDDIFWETRQKSIDYMIKLESANLMELYDIVAEIDKERDIFPQILDFWMIWYRDILMYKKLEDEKYIFYKDFKNVLLDRAKKLPYNSINNHFYEIINAKNQLENNVNFTLIIENLLLKLKERNK